MKILIVRMYPDEINISSYNCQELGLAKALTKKGNQCDIVLYTSKKTSYEEDIFIDDYKKIHIYHLKAKNILKNCFYEKRLYEIASNYDIVQTAEYDQIANVKLKKYCKKMIIYHGPYESSFTKGYKKKCIISDLYFLFHKSYKQTICISKSKLATDLLQKKGFSNVNTVGVGIDIDRFSKSNTSEKSDILAIKKFLSSKHKYLLYIGKIEKRRNIPFLLKLFSNILNQDNSYRLVIVGNGEEKYIYEINKIIENYKIKDKIIYFKNLKQNELSELYKNSEAFLLPTQYEIFGMVILESMHFGLPVITTENGGSSVLIKNKINGYICSVKEIEQWEKCILELSNNKKNKDYISTEAKNTIDNNYTWDALSKIFLKIYSK